MNSENPVPEDPTPNTLIEDIGRTLAEFADRGHSLTTDAVIRWLMNFHPDDRNLCHKLLRIILAHYYFGPQKCRMACRTIWEHLRGHGVNADNSLFVALGGPVRGAGNVLFLLRQESRSEIQVISDIHDLRSSIFEGKTLILIDDFCGTGETAWSGLQLLCSAKEFQQCSRVHLAFIAAYDKGRRYTEEHYQALCHTMQCPDLEIFSPYVLTDKDRAFSTEFPRLSDHERQRLQQICAINAEVAYYIQDRIPRGHGNTESLIVFYYNVPDNTLPIIWSGREGWHPLFVRYTRYSNLLPITPEFTAREQELSFMKEAFQSGPFHILITGESGSGKTYLAARFVQRELLEVFGHYRDSIFWHPFQSTASIPHLVRNLTDYLEDHHISGQSDLLRKSISDPQSLARAVLKAVRGRSVLVFDRIHAVESNTEICSFLKHIVNVDPRAGGTPVILICRNSNSFDHDKESTSPYLKSVRLSDFADQSAAELVQNIWNEAVHHGGKPKVLDEATRETIQALGQHGDPILLHLATSLALLLHKRGELAQLPKKVVKRSTPLEDAMLECLWRHFDDDLRLFLIAASCFDPPRYCYRLEQSYSQLSEALQVSARRFDALLEELSTFGNPFARRVGYQRDAICQMPPMICELVQRGVKKGQLHLKGQSVDLRSFHHAIADMFAREARMSLVRTDTRESRERAASYVVDAHDHYLRAGSLRECYLLLIEYRRLFTAVDQLEALLAAANRLLAKAKSTSVPKISTEEQIQIVFIILRILRALTRHVDERRICNEWLDRLTEKFMVARAELLLHRAVAAFVFCDFATTIRCCEDAIKLTKSLPNATIESRDIEDRCAARIIQVYMSQGRYHDALTRLGELLQTSRQMVEALGKEGVAPSVCRPVDQRKSVLHTVAMLCRHLCTLSFLDGDYRKSISWIDRCIYVNHTIGDLEGEAIGLYKSARAFWLLKLKEGGSLDPALMMATRSYTLLTTRVKGNRWWRIAVLELRASIHMDQLRTPGLPGNRRAELCRRVQDLLEEANALLANMVHEREPNLLKMRHSEVQLLELRLRAEAGDWSASRDGFVKLAKELSCIGSPFLEAVVRYEYAFYLAENGAWKDASDQLVVAHDLFMKNGITGNQWLPLGRMFMIAAKARHSLDDEDRIRSLRDRLISSQLLVHYEKSQASDWPVRAFRRTMRVCLKDNKEIVQGTMREVTKFYWDRELIPQIFELIGFASEWSMKQHPDHVELVMELNRELKDRWSKCESTKKILAPLYELSKELYGRAEVGWINTFCPFLEAEKVRYKRQEQYGPGAISI